MEADREIRDSECMLGGDETSCDECAYYPEYKFNATTGLCEKSKDARDDYYKQREKANEEMAPYMAVVFVLAFVLVIGAIIFGGR